MEHFWQKRTMRPSSSTAGVRRCSSHTRYRALAVRDDVTGCAQPGTLHRPGEAPLCVADFGESLPLCDRSPAPAPPAAAPAVPSRSVMRDGASGGASGAAGSAACCCAASCEAGDDAWPQLRKQVHALRPARRAAGCVPARSGATDTRWATTRAAAAAQPRLGAVGRAWKRRPPLPGGGDRVRQAQRHHLLNLRQRLRRRRQLRREQQPCHGYFYGALTASCDAPEGSGMGARDAMRFARRDQLPAA